MTKIYPIISACPVCAEELAVSKLSCPHCATHIEGNFRLSKFDYLDKEKLFFIEIFMKNRGNIKAIEKEMNISYPTVKKLLDEVIKSLGYNVEDEVEAEPTRSGIKATILQQLSDGLISVKEAIELIKNSKGDK